MRKEILKEVEQTMDELIQLISSSGEEELNEIPFEGSWSAAQVAEHLLKSYAIVDMLNAPQTKTERSADEKVELLKSVFLNFNTKVKCSK